MTMDFSGQVGEIWAKAAQRDGTPALAQLGLTAPLLARFPYAGDNRNWLRGSRRTTIVFDRKEKHWQLAKTRFEEIVQLSLERFGRVYVIQRRNAMEKCAPACVNAKSFHCECSCLGRNHGSADPLAGWRIVSDAFAFTWRDLPYSCRLIGDRSA